MDILILGNGFDLAHGLKTKYSDFLDYCIKKYSIGNGNIGNVDSFTNNLWFRHFISNELSNDKWIDLEKEIYNVIKTINSRLFGRTYFVENLFPKYYEFSTNYLENEFDLKKVKLKKFQPDYRMQTHEKGYNISKSNYYSNHLDITFETYKGFVNFLFEQLQEFTNMFNSYLVNEVIPNINDKRYHFALQRHKNIRVLNFNYTNTFEKLYDTKSINAENNPKYIYIHGKAKNDGNNNLVLGTHSFFNYLPNDINEQIDVNFNVFKKHNQRHCYNTIESYQEFIKELNIPNKITNPTFHIIGHSLDKTDHNILKHILKIKENTVINIYYHDQDALERMVNNITEIIGEEEVMTKVRFINQYDSKRGILIPKENLNKILYSDFG